MPYQIIFYEKSNGKSDVWDFLEQLRHKSMKSKDARIQYKQVLLSIELLQCSSRYNCEAHYGRHLGTASRS